MSIQSLIDSVFDENLNEEKKSAKAFLLKTIDRLPEIENMVVLYQWPDIESKRAQTDQHSRFSIGNLCANIGMIDVMKRDMLRRFDDCPEEDGD
jgi:hypothetical protein